MKYEFDVEPEEFQRLWFDLQAMVGTIISGEAVPHEMYNFILRQEQFIYELKHSVALAEIKRAGLNWKHVKEKRLVRSQAHRRGPKLPGHSPKRLKAAL